ncbi:MAG: MFS transporter [Chlorobi bacterium]|nr:MFS transporter [Chlorobiota bacterium]
MTELFERAAFYGMFISLTMYLTDTVGFSDIEAGFIGAFFSSGLYVLPLFAGALADKIGYRKSLMLAFALMTIGYFTLAALPQQVPVVIALLAFIMVGGAFIKSVITGTVAKSSNEKNRARAYSIFYSIVNVGAFTGKLIAKPIRTGIDLGPLGNFSIGIEYIGYYSATMTFIALVIVFFMFKNIDTKQTSKSIQDLIKGFKHLIAQPRLWVLILIISGFWLIQHQMYASMPKYIVRMVGEDAAPEWYANINPAMVMIFVMLVSRWTKNLKAVTTMTIGMVLMPFSVFFMSAGPLLQGYTGDSISFGFTALHPIALMMVMGIAFQGFAECFISPRYLEFFSLQSPKGEEGMYLGFAHLHSFVANFIGFGMSGILLDSYCPNPNKPELVGLSPEQLAPYYEHAHYIWYVFAGIGLLSAVSLIIYSKVLKRIDAKKEAAAV